MSRAAVIRETLDQMLVTPEEVKIERALAAVGSFSSGVTSVSRDHDRELGQAYPK
jgi:hypothetical protein